MDCRVTREQLWSWIDRDAAELEEHLRSCPRCREVAEEIRREIDFIATDGDFLELPVPDKIGPYKIRRLLGEGGQALVYEAEQPSPPRPVALKVLRGGPRAGPRSLRRFRREARALANLKHPSIATIYEAGRTEDGQYYFAMELVEGLPLDEHARRHAPTREDRMDLIRRVCEAVDYAHRHGVIHRDLKPSNILVTPEGIPKILDFGLARLADAGASLASAATHADRLEGTPRYMSPEQARGSPDGVGGRTDVYSLGVILYELLTGDLPYDVGTSPHEIVDVICDAPPRRPSAIDPALRGDLETIVLKALEKEPARRYGSVGELGEDLRRFRRGEPIRARRPSRLYVMRKLVARHRIVASLGAAAVLVAALAAWLSLRPPYDLAEARWQVLDARLSLMEGPPDRFGLSQAWEAPRRYPGLPEATLVSAQAHFLNRNLRAAIQDLEAASAREPAAWVYEAQLAEMQQETLSGPRVARAERVPPTDSADDWYLRSFVRLDVATALSDAKAALQRDPGHPLAMAAVTRLSALSGDVDRALAAADRLRRTGPRALFWTEYAQRLLVRARRYEDALEMADHMVAADPSDHVNFVRRGHLNRRLGNHEDAVRDFTHALERAGSDQRTCWIYYHRAVPLWILGRREQAAADARRAFELLTYATYANARLVLILEELGRTEEAGRELATARTKVWDDPWLARILAALAGEIEPSALVAAADTTRPGQLCEASYYAGEICLRQGRPEDARRWFLDCRRTGIESDPGYELDSMSEYDLAQWRLAQFGAGGAGGAGLASSRPDGTALPGRAGRAQLE